MCIYRTAIPMPAGAPASMGDPVVQVAAVDVADGRWPLDDTSLCELGGVIAGGIAARLTEQGVPTYSADPSSAARVLTSDPCAAAIDLHAAGFDWHDPNPEAQHATTWRHPGVCSLRLGEEAGEHAAAVVKRGLAVWSDSVLEVPWGEAAIRSEQDGVELFDFRSQGCMVVAQGTMSIEPVDVGSGAAGLAASTPVVLVRLSALEHGDCSEIGKRVALAVIKRAT